MDNLIHIKHNDNIYILEDRTPNLHEMSIYINNDKTIVSNNWKDESGEELNHVAVNWMYEKPGEELAFESQFIYVDMQIRSTEVAVTREDLTKIEITKYEMKDWSQIEGWTREWMSLLNGKTGEEKTSKTVIKLI
jgi:hypothetical protein